MKTILHFLAAFLIVSCGNDNDTKNDKNLISDIESEGYKYIGKCPTPQGISDTLLLGYTNRNHGVFHNKQLRPKDLKINGSEFEEISSEQWKSKLMLYKFEFKEKLEKNRFEEFQKFIVNYQSHSKNKVEFFMKDSNWILRFEPMPKKRHNAD